MGGDAVLSVLFILLLSWGGKAAGAERTEIWGTVRTGRLVTTPSQATTPPPLGTEPYAVVTPSATPTEKFDSGRLMTAGVGAINPGGSEPEVQQHAAIDSTPFDTTRLSVRTESTDWRGVAETGTPTPTPFWNPALLTTVTAEVAAQAGGSIAIPAFTQTVGPTQETELAERMTAAPPVSPLASTSGELGGDGNPSQLPPSGDGTAVGSAAVGTTTRVYESSSKLRTLRNRVALAQVRNAEGQSVGSISFSWCHNLNRHRPGYPEGLMPPSSVEVNVNLANCSFGAERVGAQETRCAYQISELSLDIPQRGEPVSDAVCKAAAAPFDPHLIINDGTSSSAEEGLRQGMRYLRDELFSPRDAVDCNDASRSSLGALNSCPVGSLSRIYGGRTEYFDELLAIHDSIIGRSVILARRPKHAHTTSIQLFCCPIEFWDNCATREKRALLDFKLSMGPSPLLMTWQPRNDMCIDFLGVECNNDGHVIALKLPFDALMRAPHPKSTSDDEGALIDVPTEVYSDPREPDTSGGAEVPWAEPLQGTIPRTIADLDFLEALDLSGHELNGKLPPSLVDLASLRFLDLRDNELTGSIPSEYSALVGLQEVHLEDNLLMGAVPEELLKLPALYLLNLTNDGICGTFNFSNSSAEITVNPCDITGSPVTPPPDTARPPPTAPPSDNSLESWLLLAVILPSILLLSTSISCFALVLHKRRQGTQGLRNSARTGSGGIPAHDLFDQEAGNRSDGTELVEMDRQSGKQYGEINVQVLASDGSAKLSKAFSGHVVQSPSVSTGKSGKAVTMTPPPSAIKPPAGMDDNPSLATRCPSGYSPLEYAGLPNEVEADSSRILGSGGYGVVYFGKYTAENGSQLPAAIKVISNSDYDEAHSSKFKTFQDEVDMILLFRGNDCIVQVFSYCLEFPRAYIVYEYLPNDTLARFIHNNATRHSYLQILQIGYGIAEGLHALHLMNVIHRDLKPDNILLDDHMRPKLTDFGISRKRDAAVSALSTQNLGTWSYMAPEQFHGRISEKSDVYAVGLILWECWTRKRPWEVTDDRDVWGMVFSILNEEKRPEIPEDCPRGLRSILVDCWDSNAKARPTALELKSRLWKLMTHQSRRKPPTVRKGVIGGGPGNLPGAPVQPGKPFSNVHNRGPSLETVGESFLDDSVEKETPQAATMDWNIHEREGGGGSGRDVSTPKQEEDSGNMLVPPGSHLFQYMATGKRCPLSQVDSHPLHFLSNSVCHDTEPVDGSVQKNDSTSSR